MTLQPLEDVAVSFLRFETETTLALTAAAQQQFLLFEGETTAVEQLVEPPHFVIFETPGPAFTATLDGEKDFLVITSGVEGPPGDQGTAGPQGPPGPPGADGAGSFFQTYSFAIPSTLWVIDLPEGVSALAVTVETYDDSGDPVEANIRRPSASRIEIDWFYPSTGAARVAR